eukprot:scaffold23151_cov117-Isochrysis_galbana.AAC.9
MQAANLKTQPTYTATRDATTERHNGHKQPQTGGKGMLALVIWPAPLHPLRAGLEAKKSRFSRSLWFSSACISAAVMFCASPPSAPTRRARLRMDIWPTLADALSGLVLADIRGLDPPGELGGRDHPGEAVARAMAWGGCRGSGDEAVKVGVKKLRRLRVFAGHRLARCHAQLVEPALKLCSLHDGVVALPGQLRLRVDFIHVRHGRAVLLALARRSPNSP